MDTITAEVIPPAEPNAWEAIPEGEYAIVELFGHTTLVGRIAAMDPQASDIQVREARMTFMAGAQHLFSSIMTILDPGDEPTEQDLNRIALIAAELDAFSEELKASLETKGTA